LTTIGSHALACRPALARTQGEPQLLAGLVAVGSSLVGDRNQLDGSVAI
jgi:hypothetical protein